MKINKIKINSYGNLNNKELELNKLNIIYGKNESGKSTLLNFIISILYGISKNKNGKDISDYERYTPWNGEEFSGKLLYELENKNKYEVFRNFDKKNPEIYDENGKELTKEFNIDKKLGNQFFYDQTKIDRDTLISTVITNQREIRLDNNSQNILIQKVANLAESGDEEVSYKKAIAKLDKSLLTEIGTDKSQDRPINISKKNIINYENKLNEINEAKIFKYNIEEKNKEINNKLIKKNKNKLIFNEIKGILNKNDEENEKIKIKNKIIEENNAKIEKNRLEKNKLEKNKNKKLNIIIFILLIFTNIINFILIKNKIINIIIFLLIPIFIIYYIINNKRNNSNYINTQNKILEKNNDDLIKEVEVLKNNLIKENELEKNKLIEKYGQEIKDLFNSNINLIIENNNEEINNLNLELHKLELDQNSIEPKLEELAYTEEILEQEKEHLKNLEAKSEEYDIVRELLNEAYEEMKGNVTPKFDKSLSKNIEKFSNGKYKKVILNDGLFVELDNGQYTSIENLSIGTIEQIYLSLRLSVIDEISSEKLPIMLDEAFAYYDNERLKSALELLSNAENQVIIFTCNNREKEILEKMNKEYNFIEL